MKWVDDPGCGECVLDFGESGSGDFAVVDSMHSAKPGKLEVRVYKKYEPQPWAYFDTLEEAKRYAEVVCRMML